MLTMNDSSSPLHFLANVALENKTQNTRPKDEVPRCHGRHSDTLPVRMYNGENYARLIDIFKLPYKKIMQVFFQPYENKKLKKQHRFGFVCKYECEEGKYCNEMFTAMRRDLISATEHLCKIHVTHHLTKAKAEYIKLPKPASFHGENRVLQSITVPESIAESISQFQCGEIHWITDENKTANSVAVAGKKRSWTGGPLQELRIPGLDKNIPQQTLTQKATVEKIDTSLIMSRNASHGFEFDHSSYTNVKEITSNVSSVSSNTYAVVSSQVQSVDEYERKEPSTSIIYTMLEQPMLQMISDDGNSTSDQLTVVESEAEVIVVAEGDTDEKAVIVECAPKPDESFFPCTQCDLVLSSKQVLYSHVRNKHRNTNTIFKSDKRPIRNRTAAAEPKTVKRKFYMPTKKRNADLNEVECVDGENNSILKTALLNESNKQPVININNTNNSNVWGSLICVEYE